MARSKEAEKRGPVTGQFLRKGLNTESCIRISLLHAPARLFGNVAGSVPGAAGKYAVTAISEAKKKVVSNGGSPMLGDQVGASHCFDKLSETKFRTLSKGEGSRSPSRPGKEFAGKVSVEGDPVIADAPRLRFHVVGLLRSVKKAFPCLGRELPPLATKEQLSLRNPEKLRKSAGTIAFGEAVKSILSRGANGQGCAKKGTGGGAESQFPFCWQHKS